MTPVLETVSAHELIAGILACNARRLCERPVEVNVEDVAAELYTDRLLLQILMGNLLDNAVKYSPPGSPIDIGATAGGGMVVVSVADRGEGIPNAYLDRVFELSFQVPRCDGSRRQGLGLGLPICSLIAEALGGGIGLQRRSGGGLVASIWLPGAEGSW